MQLGTLCHFRFAGVLLHHFAMGHTRDESPGAMFLSVRSGVMWCAKCCAMCGVNAMNAEMALAVLARRVPDTAAGWPGLACLGLACLGLARFGFLTLLPYRGRAARNKGCHLGVFGVWRLRHVLRIP